MLDQIIFIYSICDDLLNFFATNKDARCKMNSAEVMTALIVVALFFLEIHSNRFEGSLFRKFR
jgi:hypothetical protein